MGGVGEISYQLLKLYLRPNLRNTFDGHPLHGCLKGLIKLENVAIANALQLEAARVMPALSRFNCDAMPSFKSLN